MAWCKSTKQRKAARRRAHRQRLIREGCPERFRELLATPPEMLPKLTRKERLWAEGVAARFGEGG